MPRKPPILSNEDLQTILARPDEMPQLLEWAKGELQRRIDAGKSGGRPKKKASVTVTADKPDKSIGIKTAPPKPLAKRNKNWSTCPFGSHADDCECQGNS